MSGSWRTTLAGVLAVLAALAAASRAANDGDPATVPNWEAVVVTVMVSFGLAAARDNKVTSEQAGASPLRKAGGLLDQIEGKA